VTPSSNPEDILTPLEKEIYECLSLCESTDYLAQIGLLINRYLETGYLSFIFNYNDLTFELQKKFETTLSYEDFIQAARRVVKFMLFTYDKDYVEELKAKFNIEEFVDFEKYVPFLSVRIRNYHYDLSIQDTKFTVPVKASKSAKLNKFNSYRGVVVKSTKSDSAIVKTIMKCSNCINEHPISFYEINSLGSTGKCKACDEGFFQMAETEVNDIQYIEIQDFDDASSYDTTPITLKCLVNEDMTNRAQIGDSVIVSGVMRFDTDNEISKKLWRDKTKTNLDYYKSIQAYSPKTGGLHFPRLLEVNYIEVNNSDDYTNYEKHMEEIEAMKKLPNLYELLIASFCPEVKGHENIKEGLLLSLFGGVGKFNSPIDKRGNLRVMIISDPSIAKSVMLKYVTKLMKRAFYASATSSSKIGLTAAAVRDEQTGEWTIAAGAILRCNGSILCIDEISKLDDEARAALYEVAEQETYTMAKAGILKTFNVNLVLIVAGNPKGGRYDPNLSVHQNLSDNQAPFLTRFDLKYIMRDIPDSKKDREIAEWVMDQYNDDFKKHTQGLFSYESLARYIAYTRRFGTQPKMTKEAMEVLKNFYDDTRQSIDMTDPEAAMAIVVREFEGVIRIATAKARSVWSNVVDAETAKYAIKLHDSMLVGIAPSDKDPTKPDLNKLYDKSKGQENTNDVVMTVVHEMVKSQNRKRLDRTVLVSRLLDMGMPANKIDKAFRSLDAEGQIITDSDYITLI
jgi:replicative DNA helicase Mcm